MNDLTADLQAKQASVPELEAQKRKIHEVFSKADAAVHTGKVTAEQRDALMRHYYGTTSEREAVTRINEQIEELKFSFQAAPKATALIIGFCALMLSLFSVLFISTGGITGAVIGITPVDTTYTESASIPLELVNATRLNITGIANGYANIRVTLTHESTTYKLYEYLQGPQATPHASLPKRQYEAGEPIIYTAENVSSAYLMTATDAITLDNTTIEGLGVGEYTIRLLIQGETLTEELLGFSVVAPGTPAPSAQFSTCGELCETSLNGNATLDIEIEGGSLTLDDIIIQTGNTPPTLSSPIPDATGELITIDLAQHFSDADGDTLLYDTTHHDGITESLESGIFTATGTPGTYTYIAYASDGTELTPSNIFSVTITSNETEPVETPLNQTLNETPVPDLPLNQTLNETLNETVINETLINTTGNTTGNGTVVLEPAPEVNLTLNTTLDCSAPDPNNRPLDCLNLNATKFFEEDIFWEDLNRNQVARITPIGNLLITGRVFKGSTAAPPSRAFSIGHKDNDFNYVPTIWIDESGNLHLRGTLHEENANINPPTGTYSIINRRGVYMAYADTSNGDLHVRGNVIPYRDSIYE